MSDEPDDDRSSCRTTTSSTSARARRVRRRRGRGGDARLFAADGPPDLDEGLFAGPLYWPEIPAADIEQEFRELRAWVQELIERFEHLDHKAIPVVLVAPQRARRSATGAP